MDSIYLYHILFLIVTIVERKSSVSPYFPHQLSPSHLNRIAYNIHMTFDHFNAQSA